MGCGGEIRGVTGAPGSLRTMAQTLSNQGGWRERVEGGGSYPTLRWSTKASVRQVAAVMASCRLFSGEGERGWSRLRIGEVGLLMGSPCTYSSSANCPLTSDL